MSRRFWSLQHPSLKLLNWKTFPVAADIPVGHWNATTTNRNNNGAISRWVGRCRGARHISSWNNYCSGRTDVSRCRTDRLEFLDRTHRGEASILRMPRWTYTNGSTGMSSWVHERTNSRARARSRIPSTIPGEEVKLQQVEYTRHRFIK